MEPNDRSTPGFWAFEKIFDVHVVQAEIEREAEVTIESRTPRCHKVKAILRMTCDSTDRESEARAYISGDVIQKILCPHGRREEQANNCREKDSLHPQLLHPPLSMKCKHRRFNPVNFGKTV